MESSLVAKCLLIVFISLESICSYCQKPVTGKNSIYTPMTSADSIILANDCLKRREFLSQKLSNGVIIINNNEKTHDDFYYLTGWSSEPACAFIDLSNTGSFTLFIPGTNAQSVMWNGIQPGKNDSRKLGANNYSYFDFKSHLRQIVKTGKKIYMLSQDDVVKDAIKSKLLQQPDSVHIPCIDDIVHEMRVIKSQEETENIRKAIDITSSALNNAFRYCKPNMYEYEIAALLQYEYVRNNAKEAFPSICGSGRNSTALHYKANNRIMLPVDLLLIDVGAKYNNYSADITRTVPVSGKFTQSQLDIYNLVLKAQEEGIKLMKPGYKFMDFHNRCADVICKGLYQLGLVTDTSQYWQMSVYFYHQSGHFLGIDVHDAGYIVNSPVPPFDKRGRDLEPGMVITIEPGIYIQPDMLKFVYDIYGSTVSKEKLDDFVSKVRPVVMKYANIGIRIEDDILITPGGNEVLSASIPKHPEDIERLMNKKQI